MTKIVVTIVVVLAIAVGAYYWYVSTQHPAVPVQTTAQVTGNTQPAPATGASAAVAASGNSDAAIQSDAAAIDSQMSSFSSDNSSVNSAMNDQPVQQGNI